MKKLPDEVEQDILNFIKKFDHMEEKDLKDALRLMFTKHLQIVESDFLLTGNNLYNIINKAKDNYIKLPSEVYLDGLEHKNRLTQGTSGNEDQLKAVCLVQATLEELRNEEILYRTIKFNFKTR